MPKNRVYSEKEISAVLRRAAELQQARGPSDASGLSLSELEQIAAEVGLDPDLVRTAASELDEGTPDRSFHLLGAPTTLDLERIVEGELTEETWEEVVAEIQRALGAAGETRTLGRTREWVLGAQTAERAHVTVSPVGKQTRIRISYNMTEWAVMLHVPLMSVVIAPIILVFVLLHLGPLVETGIALSIVLVFHMIARLAFGAIARKKERQMRKLLGRLDDLIAAPMAEQPPPERLAQQSTRESGRIDEALLSDTDVPEPAPGQRRTERKGGRKRSGS